MWEANPNKEEAINFIKKNKGIMTNKEIIQEAAAKFNYSEDTIRKFLYSYTIEMQKEKMTLRQKLDMIEKKHQEAYERRLEMAVKNSPKIRIEE